ncbi:hypothetical protein HELRODRAFT_138036, partial [Helobdella robusta]|uniref:Homeobox domain-containing protein n=1 Tax=Helobdella robusta TaxID=6412 RepID=T1EIR0_HELRO
RRERFVFRPNHLDLLDKCFAEENYPSLRRREEIARTCNLTTERITGRPLSDKERVGVHTISNWFANKRKDLKK